MRLALSFMNGIGNFIFLTAAIKVLKKWGYDDITLHTLPGFLKNPALMELSEGMFTEIIPEEPDMKEYGQFLFCGWSTPPYMYKYRTGWMGRILRTNDFRRNGMHEVQLYLNMIGASWKDFDGYILDTSWSSFVDNDRNDLKIALANPNPSRSQQASHKSWDKMPELSELLVEMGYDVYLIGMEDELKYCRGTDFTGKLSITETAKVIEECDLLIAPSTCAAIIADAVRTPLLQLEGPIVGSKTRPLQIPYATVRHQISCAPCFQQKVMRFCMENICMTGIQVEDVMQKLFIFQKHIRYPKSRPNVQYRIKQVNNDPEYESCDKKIAYLFPCFNRYEILEECLVSFKNSNPQKGAVLFLNDAGLDPRVRELIEEFEVDGLTKYVYETDWKDKLAKMALYLKTPSAHAYNRLLREVLELEKIGIKFDFINIIDPDTIFKKNWSQHLINLYDEVSVHEDKIGLISGFNYTNHPKYDDRNSEVIYTSNGNKQYRYRKGANLHYMMTTRFFKEVYGFYPCQTEIPSADVSKAAELDEKGYKTLVAVPSLMQQIGAFGSSFSRLKSDEIAYDY